MFIGSLLLLIISGTSSLAEDPPLLFSKRALTDLHEVREKEDPTSSKEEVQKRAPMGFQGMRGKKDVVATDAEDELQHEDFDKRALMGFQGMRGKKEYLMPDFEDSYFREEYDKRAPMGFQGMRGKKALLEEEYYKRAPMGFQGMRGKKLLEEVLDEIEKRAVMGFQGMRGKKTNLVEYHDDYEKRGIATNIQRMLGRKEEIPTDLEKRAPMGFQGMRGKKSVLEEIEELEKRAVMGFQGMRGKKVPLDIYTDYVLDPLDYDKRAPMGFQGMRGKKDTDKRGPMGFQGMRGKRNVGQTYAANPDFDRSTVDFQGLSDRRNGLVPYPVEKRSPFRYFGMRGKKNPRWEIRGKFVGVRGKKWAPYEEDIPLISVFDNIERIGMDGDSSTSLACFFHATDSPEGFNRYSVPDIQ